MAQTLDLIEQVKGPIESFPNPHPVPEFRTEIEGAAIVAHAPLTFALNSEGPPLRTVIDSGVSVRTDYELGRSELDVPRIEVDRMTLNTEIQQLELAEGASSTIDTELATLDSLNPAKVTGVPIIFTTPELDAVETGYNSMDTDWDLAYPLWPFTIPPG